MLRYAITDRARLAGDERASQVALLEQAAHLPSQNIDFLQLREPDLPAGTLASLAREILSTLRQYEPRPKLLIHSRADIAIAVEADGVHLSARPGALTPQQVRQLYTHAGLPSPIVSISCHTLAEVARAAGPDAAASLILFGPVFEKVVISQTDSTETLVAPGTGLDLLRAAATAAAPTPVLALGGVTQANAPACIAAGAAGIAAIRLFL
jgi:thiamine-phosphate pyrophosphorylase